MRGQAPHVPFATALLLGLSLGLGSACCNAKQPPTPQTAARPARPSLRLVVMTDLSGFLEPCGCQARPLGGIDRAAHALKGLRADGVPTLLIAAGNLLYGSETSDPKLDGSDAEAARQAQWQAEALAKILGKLELAAAVPGVVDLAHAAEVRADAEAGGFPLLGLASGEGDDTAPHSSLVRNAGGTRVGLSGLRAAAASSAQELAASAQRLIEGQRAQGAIVTVLLLDGDARSARRLAGAVRGLDFLVAGGADSADVPPPERIGQTTLLRAAHRGHGLLVVELTRAGDGVFEDASAWTRKAKRAALEQRIAELAARVAEWERDPAVDRTALAGQKTQLGALRTELDGDAKAPRPQGNSFDARFIELGPEEPQDPEVRALLDAHNKRVNEHNREALANVLPKKPAPGQPAYVGSERCKECHAPAFEWWQGHPHGNAYATLERRNVQFNLSCVGCHVTGYNQPGGSTVVHVENLKNVGCESCHGPASLHAARPTVEAAKNVRREVPETICGGCHTPEHSDRFAYAAYRARLLVPGHGQPAPGRGAKP